MIPRGAEGPEAEGPEAEGPEAEGPEAEGPEAEGPEAEGPEEGAHPAEGRTQVAAAVVVADDRVLVQTRPEGRRYAGWWEFPGGKLESGEDIDACVVRECHEELDLAVEPVEHLLAEEWSYPGHEVHVTFVLCRLGEPGADAPRAVEGQALRWADVDDLANLRFLPANARLLTLLIARLGG